MILNLDITIVLKNFRSSVTGKVNLHIEDQNSS